MQLPGGLVVQPDVATALSVLPVVGLVYAMVHRVRKHLDH
jgi:uncharacterized membrane-anchored protein